MMDVEQRARKLLADEFARMGGVSDKYVEEVREGIVGPWDRAAIRAIIAALTPPEGHVVVTRNEAGQAVAVTRQDGDGRILSVIAEFEAPEGYVLVPVEPTDDMLNSGLFGLEPMLHVSDIRAIYDDMLSARPEVKP